MTYSLKTRALLFVFIILSMVIGANTVFVSHEFALYQEKSFQNKTKLLGEHLREKMSRALNIGLPLDSLEGVDESCRSISEDNKEVGYCMVIDTSGRVLYHSDPLYAGRALKDKETSLAASTPATVIQPITEDGIRYYDISVPVFDPEQRMVGAIRLGLKKSVVDEQIYPLLLESAVVGIITFLLASFIVSFYVNRKIVAPIAEMSGTASLIARGDWSRRLDITDDNEVGQLARSFNRMAESLRDREERVKDGYRDLEKANAELQSSYAKLEETAGELELKSLHLKENLGELSLLHDATDRLRLSIDLDDILSSIAGDITLGLGYERVLVALVNEKSSTLEEKISLGFDGTAREPILLPLDSGDVFSLAVSGRKAQYVAQASLDSRVPAGLASRLDLNEFAIIPMVGKEHCVGAILIDNRKTLKPIRRDKLDILSTFSSTAAMMVENAYLYRQLMENIETVERANRELHQLDKAKTNFLSLASHELRTPLVSVMGYLNLMLSGDLGEITPEQREMLEIATKGAFRLRDITEDLLMVAKIEGGHLPLKLEWISLDEVVKAAMGEVGRLIDQREVDIRVEPLDLLPKVEADFDRLRQCMTNLIGNAVKYTPDHGTITISGRKVTVDKDGGLKPLPYDNSILSADTCIELVVEDTGIGINRENIEKIFDKFYEVADVDAHSTGKVKFMGGGTGLGLSIVRGIVESLHGRIWAESDGEDVERCPGTRFKILLPMKQPSGKSSPPAALRIERVRPPDAVPAGRGADRPKVLLIEDDEDTVAFAKLVLEKKFAVTVARDGFEGIKKAFIERPEAILLDVWMGGIDGFEVCKILKENKTTAAIPVAMFTAAAQKEEMERGFSAGAKDYITKPFTPAELLQRVEKLMGRLIAG